jgi:CMP-N,N'-diacetyllegionaminic acid synthase
MKLLCVIPARGGSKGVPGKNLRNVAGRPLINWSIAHALGSTTPMRVIVSTDDEEIAAVAADAGAEVPFLRPAELATDDAPTEPTVLHAIAWVRSQGWEPDAVVLLQATSPIRGPDSIDRAIAQFVAEDADSLVGVVRSSPFLWWQGDPPTSHYRVEARERRQDMDPATLPFRETGSLYVTRTDIYDTRMNRLGGRISLFEMDEIEGLDIDTELDITIAESALRATPVFPASNHLDVND